MELLILAQTLREEEDRLIANLNTVMLLRQQAEMEFRQIQQYTAPADLSPAISSPQPMNPPAAVPVPRKTKADSKEPKAPSMISPASQEVE